MLGGGMKNVVKDFVNTNVTSFMKQLNRDQTDQLIILKY